MPTRSEQDELRNKCDWEWASINGVNGYKVKSRIGAGPHCDGQVLVMHDMLGLNNSFSPRFLRRYANLHEESLNAIRNYVADVKSCDFPSEKEAY